MSVNRWYVSNMEGGVPVLNTLVAGLGESGARVVSAVDTSLGQALCNVRATNHLALSIDTRVILLFDCPLDVVWGLLGTPPDRKALVKSLLSRGLGNHSTFDPNSLYGEVLQAIGMQLDGSFNVLNFSA